MWSWQDLILAGIGFWNSEMAGTVAFLVGSIPCGKGKALAFLSFLWLGESGVLFISRA